ncbi:hypothetical protein BUALT_Bualt11G0127800 [Buddleja alternifolia]|uniref:Protein NRT1/ PTR FAMILY 5.5-like n=1 Tax=Buddleja alternifolia TaxID=168488 RepID=A0AAV6WUN1_9LAMI|nr:hypothetical protein BUALT_Bualt11G0127800 [Buddleja alternifolia]
MLAKEISPFGNDCGNRSCMIALNLFSMYFPVHEFPFKLLLYADFVVELAFFEIWSMQTYLTGVWKMSVTRAAAILNIWEGIIKMLPICFVLLVDTLMGDFLMLVLSSIAYCVGLSLLFTSSSLVRADCQHDNPMCVGDTETILFCTALALIAVGISGHRVSLRSFLNEQLSDADIGLSKWAILFPIYTYSSHWRYWPSFRKTMANPLWDSSNLCRCGNLDVFNGVFVASASKISQQFPREDARFYNNVVSHFRTSNLKCLDRAAFVVGEELEKNRWKLCTITEVEETKLLIRLVPIWITFIVCGIVSSFANTYFQEQANHMNNKMGKLDVPPIVLLVILKWVEVASAQLYGLTIKRPGKYATRIGILVAMIFSVLCCITAAGVETRRLSVVRRYGLVNKPDDDIPMSIFWLLMQICLLAIMNSLLKTGIDAFYKYYAPPSLLDYLNYFAEGALGVGFTCGPLLVSIVGKISEKGGKISWFQHTLNRSRLDKYYWVMAALCSVNLLVYILVASIYEDRQVPDDREGSSTPEGSIEG